MSRKHFLTICILIVITAGVVFASIPFMASLMPSAGSDKILEIDISDIAEGDYEIYVWKDAPLLIYKPSVDSSQYLISLNDVTNGPDYTPENIPNLFIYRPISTHLGCALRVTGEAGHHVYKYVGLWDPCHRGFWDYTGRLLPKVHNGKGLENLMKVEDYVWVSDAVIRFAP